MDNSKLEFNHRELQILELVGQGASSHSEIVEHTGLSPDTVAQYVTHLGRRLPGTGKPMFKIQRYWLTVLHPPVTTRREHDDDD